MKNGRLLGTLPSNRPFANLKPDAARFYQPNGRLAKGVLLER